jgi:two-component system cell cycle sensor histidine kinase/response regulator CckA
MNIKGSPVHLSKSVMNLVSNAAEAMSEGGTISISTENRYVDTPIRGYDHVEEGDYVTVTVSDTGIGISKEDRERIFEPFYTKKVMGRSGTGLGMAVVWGTIKDHKGYIDIQSTRGKGTTFTLYFPITREEIATDKPLLSTKDYIGKGESILIVDDVKEQREIASVMLKKLGYSVTSVPSGEEAIEYMKDNSADLLILDMIMDPGIDGLETYKRILTLHPHQKAIIASGFSETDRVKEAQRRGAGAYVKKPYTLEKIGLAVRNELDKHKV